MQGLLKKYRIAKIYQPWIAPKDSLEKQNNLIFHSEGGLAITFSTPHSL
jgi:hypothetical protein